MKSPSVSPLVKTTTTSDNRKSSSTAAIVWNHRSRPAVADGNHIRSRLLRQLGIVSSVEVRMTASRPCTPMRKVAAFSEPLKYDRREVGSKKKSQQEEVSVNNKSKNKKPHQSVAFETEVSVIPIPRHQEYSQRIRSRLWCNKRELRTMAARNTIEYQAEGWDWRTVAEDDEFIITASGERIHPVHLRRLLSSPFIMRQPMRVLQQQQQQFQKTSIPDVDKKTVVCCPDPLPSPAPEELARQ